MSDFFKVCKERKILVLHVGYSNLEGDKWKRTPYGSEPGIMNRTDKIRKANPTFARWIAKLLKLLSHDFPAAIKAERVKRGEKNVLPMFEVDESRRKYLIALAKALDSGDDKEIAPYIDAPALTLVGYFNHVVSTRLMTAREGLMHVLTSSHHNH